MNTTARADRIIAFRPEVARALGDIESAIFYQQIYFWGDKGVEKDGYIYKTIAEIEDETTLSEYHQTRIVKSLVKKGWLLYELRKGEDDRVRRYFKPLMDISTNFTAKNGRAKNLVGHTKNCHIPPYTEKTTDISLSEKKQIQETILDSDGEPVRRKASRKAAASRPEFSLAITWVELVSSKLGISRDMVPVSKFFFVAKKCHEKYKLSRTDFVALFEQFLDDPKLSREQKLSYQLCLSESYVSKYLMRRDRVPKTFAEISGEIKL